MEDISLGEKIKKLRKQSALSQADLASKINVSRNTVSKWELNEFKPSIEKLRELCELFSVNIEYFLGAQSISSVPVREDKPKEAQNKKESKHLIVLSVLMGVSLIFCIICGIICLANQGGYETQYWISLDFYPLRSLIEFAIISVILIGVIIFFAIKTKKSNKTDCKGALSLGEKIKMLRKQSGLSQEELAVKIDVIRNTVSKWELNESKPSAEKLQELCNLFFVNIEYLLDDRSAITGASDSENPSRGAQSKIRSMLVIACLSALLIICLFFCAICGYIHFTYGKSEEFDMKNIISFGVKPLGAFIISAIIFVILLSIVIFLIIKNRKNP